MDSVDREKFKAMVKDAYRETGLSPIADEFYQFVSGKVTGACPLGALFAHQKPEDYNQFVSDPASVISDPVMALAEDCFGRANAQAFIVGFDGLHATYTGEEREYYKLGWELREELVVL